MAPELRCVECGTHSGPLARGWLAIRCDDPEQDGPPELAFYCPECARAEFEVEVRHDPRAE